MKLFGEIPGYRPSLFSRACISLLLVVSVALPIASPLVVSAQAAGTEPSVAPGSASAASVPIEDITGSCNFGLSPSNCILQVLYFFFVTITSWFAAIAGIFFDFAADMSLTSGTYVSGVINQAWVIARDLANMAFVFLLIYLAFQLILNLEGVGVGKSLGKIIAVALLINFSFFFSRVVIDASNILAHQFYDQIAGPTEKSTDPNNVTKYVRGISANVMNGVNIQTLFRSGTNGTSPFSQFINAQRAEGSAGFGLLAMLFILFGVMNIILMFVFFAASFQLIARIVVLWIAIIFSPLGFVSFAIPGAEGVTSKWWNFLLKNAFFAPVFFLLLYIIVAMVSGINGAPSVLGGDLAAALSSQLTPGVTSLYKVAEAMALILLRLGLITGLLLAALKAGEYVGATGAEKMASWGKKFGVGTTVGLTAWGLRNTAGRAGYALSRNVALRDAASRNVFARTLWRGARTTGAATFDARSLPGASDLGAGKAGGKGGFVATVDAKAKNLEKEAKDLKNDAVDKKGAEARYDANFAKEKGITFETHLENLATKVQEAAAQEEVAANAEKAAATAFAQATQQAQLAHDNNDQTSLSQQRVTETGMAVVQAQRALDVERQRKAQAKELREEAVKNKQAAEKTREGASKAEDKARLESFAETLSTRRIANVWMPSRGAIKAAGNIRDLAKGKSATDKIKEAVTELESSAKPEEKPAEDKKDSGGGGDHKK